MALHPIKALDHVIEEYADYLRTEFRAETAVLRVVKFDELKRLGRDAFTRKYDPYHDIPLNENHPQPVIDLPIPREAKKSAQGKLS
jgi:hypothetical protein